MNVGTSGPATTLGRTRELAVLSGLVERVAGGRGSAVVIEAPPGLGKTTIVRCAEEIARAAPIAVFSVSGSELARTSPWAVASQIVEALVGRGGTEHGIGLEGPSRRALDLILPDLPPALGSAFPLVHGVCCAVRDLANDTPMLITVDDAHLADDESIDLLATLLERGDDAPYGLLIARRPPSASAGAATARLDHAASAANARRLVLGALDDAAIESMVDAALAARAGDHRPDVVRAAGGNPLLAREAIELVQHAVSVDEPEPSLSELVDHDSASIVRRSTLSRLGASGEGALPVATTIAVLGGHAEVSRVAAVSGVALDLVVDITRRLERNGVVEVAGTPSIRHPLVEQMVLAEAGDLRVAQLHASAARALHDDGATASDVAAHLVRARASCPAEPWKSACLREVATRQLALGAPKAAAELLVHALDLAAGPVERIEVSLELARAETADGRTTALDRLHEVRRGIDRTGGAWSPTELGLLAQVGEAQYAAGQFDRAEQTFDLAIESLGLGGDTVAEMIEPLDEADALTVARLLVGRDSASLLGGGPSRLDTSVDALARSAGSDPSLTVRLLAAMRAGERALGIDVEPDTLAMLIAAVQAGDALPDALSRPVFEPIGAALAMSGQADDAHDLLSELIDGAAAQGDIVSHVSLLPIRAYAALGQGRVVAALGDATDALRLEDEVPSSSRYAGAPARYAAAVAHIERDDLDAARAVVALDDRGQRWAGSPMYGWYLVAVGSVALESERFAEAADAFAKAGQAFTTGGGSGSVVAWRSGLARALDRLDDQAGARGHLADERAAAASLGDPRLSAESARTAAMVERDHRRAAAALQVAADTLACVNAPLQVAGITIDRGIRLRRAGERREARAALRKGLDLARGCGSRRLCRVAMVELEEAGARRPQLATTGADALTPSESRVATLVIEGRSNKDVADALFVTVKTVETHLSSVYRKLGIGRRSDLAAALDIDPVRRSP